MTSAELDTVLQQTIDDIKADIYVFDERAAIQQESREAQERGKTTTNYAIAALQQPDTNWGKHDVARAWLRRYEPHTRVFVKVAAA